MGLANVRIRHVFKFSESLELPRCDEVVILLPSEHLEYSLSVRIEVQLIVITIVIRQDEFQETLLSRPGVHRRILLLSSLASFPFLTLRVRSWCLIENVRR